jgi:tetratricopeptide (TPR) repeat protein
MNNLDTFEEFPMKKRLPTNALNVALVAILLTTFSSVLNTVSAQAFQQLLDACPGCPLNQITVNPPKCVDCEENAQAAPSVQSISSYNTDLQGVYTREGQQENNKGIAAYNSRDWNKAISHFKKALKFMPDDGNIRTNLNNAIAQRDYAEGAAARAEAAAAARAQYERDLVAYNQSLEAKKEADKMFLEKLNRDLLTYNTQLRKLENEVSYVPSLTPKPTRVIHEGVMLGIKNTQTDNSILGLASPWSKTKYESDQIFATTDDVSNAELLRGFLDNNYLGEYTLSTPYGQQLIERIRGTHFDRLVAHSNGATIAEALIRRGIITVNELNVMGGDRSFVNFGGWNELITSGKVARVVVWVNPGDPVPFGTTFLPLMNALKDRAILDKVLEGKPLPLNALEKMQEGAKLKEYTRNFASFVTDRITGENKGGAMAEYRILRGPQYKGQFYLGKDEMLDAHDSGNYNYNVAKKLDEVPVNRPR